MTLTSTSLQMTHQDLKPLKSQYHICNYWLKIIIWLSTTTPIKYVQTWTPHPLTVWATSATLKLSYGCNSDVTLLNTQAHNPDRSSPSSLPSVLLSTSQAVASQDSSNMSQFPLGSIIFQAFTITSLNGGNLLYAVISFLQSLSL